MRLDAHLLHRSPIEGVRMVVRALLDEAQRALARMERKTDEEALHDFRVALRRLRSTLRAFRAHLRGRLRRKDERRLRRITAVTNVARDSEVQLAWLAEQRHSVPPRGLPGVDWLAGRLEAQRRQGYEGASGHLAARFARLAERLTRHLEGGRAPRRETGRELSFGSALADLVRGQAAVLDEMLDRVTSPLEVEPAHRARIAAKRLRYLLEPLREMSEADATAAVKSLKALQEVLGELHDAHVSCEILEAALVEAAAERARRVHAAIHRGSSGGDAVRRTMRDEATRGLLILDRRATERAIAVHQRLVREWLPRDRAVLAQAVADVVRGLDAIAPHARSVSRRFLLMRFPEELRQAAPREIEIGWLSGPRLQAWVSRVRDERGVRFFRGEPQAGRSEPRETEIDAEAFEGLWPATEAHRLHKRRRRAIDGSRVWFVDELLELERVLAEVSALADEALRMPPWLEPLMVREVTGEKAYQDVRLAGRRRRTAQRAPEPSVAAESEVTTPTPSETAPQDTG